MSVLLCLPRLRSCSEPAIGRIPGISFPLIVLLVNGFIFAGPIYDFITRRRIHPVYLE